MKKLLFFSFVGCIGLINAASPAIEVTETPLKAEIVKKEMPLMAKTVALEKYDTKVINNTGQTIELEINYATAGCTTARRTIRAGSADSVTANCCLKDMRVKLASGPLTGQSRLVEGDPTYISGTSRYSCKSNTFVAYIQNRLIVELKK